MTEDLLLSAKLKIDRANRHIQELESLAPGWTLGAGYRFVVHPESEPGGKQLLQVKLDGPRGLASVIIGEVVYQLRSTLDVATVALARANRVQKVNHIYFPIANSWKELIESNPDTKGTPQWKIRGLSDAAKRIIYDLHPYPTGNDALCGLNQLRNEEAHVELTPIAASFTNLARIDPGGGWDAELASIIGSIVLCAAPEDRGLHDGLVADVTDVAPDLPAVIDIVNTHFKLAVEVCFSNSKAFEGEPVVATLNKLSATISEIVRLFEEVV